MTSASDILVALACGSAGCPCSRSAERGSGKTHCPAHADEHPSFDVTEKEGHLLFVCRSQHCSQESIIAQLRTRGLWGTNGRSHEDFHSSGPRNGSAVTKPKEDSRPQLVCVEDVEAEPVRWVWRARIPLGKVTVLDGDPGNGKSLITMDLAARVTRGAPMPDGDASDIDGPADILLLSAEDEISDTIRPRLTAAGADLHLCHVLTGVRDKQGEAERPWILPDDLPRLGQALLDTGARFVVIDPLMAFLSADTDAHRDQDIRRALSLLSALAVGMDVAIVIVRHLNKGSSGNPLYRGGGSIGIIGAARSGLAVAKDPEDPEGHRRILASTKCNLAVEPPSLAYHVEAMEGVPRVCWEGVSPMTAADVLATHLNAEERGEIADAKEFLRERLADGPAPVKEVEKDARAEGISERTLNRARKALRIRARKAILGGGWMLSFDEGCQPGATGLGTLGTLRPNGPESASEPVSAKGANSTGPEVGTLRNSGSEGLPEADSPKGAKGANGVGEGGVSSGVNSRSGSGSGGVEGTHPPKSADEDKGDGILPEGWTSGHPLEACVLCSGSTVTRDREGVPRHPWCRAERAGGRP